MAKRKSKNVTLYAKGLDQKKPFPIENANEILNMAHPGWELADENFIFKDGNLIENRSSGANKNTSEHEGS